MPPTALSRFLQAFVAYSHTMQVLLMAGPRMNIALWLAMCAAVFSGAGLAQNAIYRCGNEYTNTVSDPVARGCKKIEGTTITVAPLIPTSLPKPSPDAPSRAVSF